VRYLFYSHDSYGLGHIRRTIHVASRLVEGSHDASALVLTGSPRSHYFDYPPRCDYLKLPSVTKEPDGSYVARELEMSIDETVEMRARLIRSAARSFRPDAFLADHTPRGLGGEILPTLADLKAEGCTRILGMRDVIDEPERVRAAWEADGTLEVLGSSYDLILVYGQRDIFDPVAEYDLPPEIAHKVRFIGYVCGNGSRNDPDDLRRRYAPSTGRLVAVTAGGGGDGNLLIHAFLRGYSALGRRPPFEAVLVTGPLMSPRKRRRVLARAERTVGVTAVEYLPDLPALYRAADLVVGMAGYNSICEMSHAGARAIVVPRTHPRREQLLRARLLARRGVVQVLLPEEATPDTLMRNVRSALERERPPRRWGLDLDGLDRLRTVLGSQRRQSGCCEHSPRACAGARR